MKSNSNFVKQHTDFSYVLPNSCFTEQLSMPASEYTNKSNKRYFSVCQEWKYKKWTHTYQKKEKVIKNGEQFFNIYRPVNEWCAMKFAWAHTHQYLFRQATIALAKLYMKLKIQLKILFYSSPSVLIINSFMLFYKKSIRGILQ